MLMIPAQQILHTILNHLSQCHLGVQLDLCISEIEYSRIVVSNISFGVDSQCDILDHLLSFSDDCVVDLS